MFSLEPSSIALCVLPSAVLWPLPCTPPSTDDGAHGARPQGICIIYTDFNIRSSQALQLGVPGPGGGDGGGPHAIASRLVQSSSSESHAGGDGIGDGGESQPSSDGDDCSGSRKGAQQQRLLRFCLTDFCP